MSRNAFAQCEREYNERIEQREQSAYERKSMSYEPDAVRCQAVTNSGARCTYTATHSNGGKALCERHHQLLVAMKAPVKKEKGK